MTQHGRSSYPDKPERYEIKDHELQRLAEEEEERWHQQVVYWQAFALMPDADEVEETILKDSSNPVAQLLLLLLLPAIGAVAKAEQASRTREAMLRAAIDVVGNNPSRLKDHLDPFDGKPFQRKELAGGFELQSAMIHRDKPVTLTIGGAGE